MRNTPIFILELKWKSMKFLFSNDLDIWASTYLKRSQTRFKCLSHDDEYKMWLEKKCSHRQIDAGMEIVLPNREQQEEPARLHRYSSSSIALWTVDFRHLTSSQAEMFSSRIYLSTVRAFHLWSNEYTVVYNRISVAVVIVQSAATCAKSSSNPPFISPLVKRIRLYLQ